MTKPRLSAAVYWGTIAFLFLPLLVLVVFSFNAGRGMVWTGFSLRWYGELFGGSEPLWKAFGNSILIGLASATVATILGTLGGIGLTWYRFKLKTYVSAISFMPLILPEIILGISMLWFFGILKIQLGLFTVFAAHVTFTLPFVLLMVQARLEEFDFTIIEAAKDLGANERDVLFRVLLPISVPGIVSGFLTALTLSLEDFVVTFFVSGPGSTTLPVYLYSAIKRSVPPEIRPLSVLLILATVLLVFLGRRFIKYIVKK